MDFYNSLNYTFGNEDWAVEKKALQVEQGDSVLCVTASGDRPFHLLLTPCQKVVSIDINQSQTALLELKIAAYNRFDYAKCLAFLGCDEASDRLNLYNEIKADLSASARLYWDQNQNKIAQGIIYQGRTERLCRFAARLMNLARKEKNQTLFSFYDIEQQRAYLDKIWDTRAFRKMFEIVIHPFVFKYLSNDPGMTAYIECTSNTGNYLYEKMLRYLYRHLAYKSALLQLIFMGRVNSKGYHPYLTYAGYEIIRKRLSCIEYYTTNMLEFLQKSSTHSFNCFSMSDIASYMSQSSFETLLKGISHAATSNARFCLRELFSDRQIPTELVSIFQRDSALEKRLESEESNFVYRFMAGRIVKTV